MTATATEKELNQVVGFLALRSKPVMIVENPVQPHLKLSVVQRPSNAFGLEGRVGDDGVLKPGLWNLLDEIYFREAFRDLSAGRSPKKCIIFTRGMGLMAQLHTHLRKDSNDSNY